MPIELAKVREKAAELKFSLDAIADELKRVQSVKCRLAKQKFKSTYEAEMREVLAEEQLLKETRGFIKPAKATVTTITEAQVALLSWDDTIKAIKSIQSKKTNTKYETPDIATNAKHQEAIRIEKMLLAHKATLTPTADTVVKKIDLALELAHLESLNLEPLDMLARLKKLLG